MNILVDENIPALTIRVLRDAGHDVRDLRGSSEQGASDVVLWAIAQSEARLLITTDKGFAAYRNQLHHGILIVRLHQPNLMKIHDRILRAMAQFKEHEWSGLMVVMRDSIQSIFQFTP